MQSQRYACDILSYSIYLTHIQAAEKETRANQSKGKVRYGFILPYDYYTTIIFSDQELATQESCE